MTTAPTAHQDAVGTAHTRVEGRDKVTGAARYAGEIPFTGLVHGWLALSTVARGRIRAIDTADALGMPGVLVVLTHENAPRVTTDYAGLMGMKPDPTTAVFQHDRVPHRGWPVALVVAETSEQAREAAEALVVHYEQETHDIAFAAGHPDAYALDAFGPAVIEKGDLDAELAASAAVVDAEYSTPEEHHNPMEPHAVTVRWEGVGSKSSTPTRAPCGSPVNSPACSPSTRPRCGSAPSTSAAASAARASARTRSPPSWPRPSSSAPCGWS